MASAAVRETLGNFKELKEPFQNYDRLTTRLLVHDSLEFPLQARRTTVNPFSRNRDVIISWARTAEGTYILEVVTARVTGQYKTPTQIVSNQVTISGSNYRCESSSPRLNAW